MGFLPRRYRTDRRAADRSLLRFLLVLLLIYGGVRMLTAHYKADSAMVQQAKSLARAQAVRIRPGAHDPLGPIYGFGGLPVVGSGSLVDLGPALPGPGQAVFAWLFGAREMVLSSCLTELPPAAATAPRLPIRAYLPGFYGAPWTAGFDGNLVALLHVYAPRDARAPVAAPILQIYRNYDGQATAPSFDESGAVRVYRGGKAVLYRVFLGGPVRCLDLVVRHGQSTGTGYLYYQRYRRYYEAEQDFALH